VTVPGRLARSPSRRGLGLPASSSPSPGSCASAAPVPDPRPATQLGKSIDCKSGRPPRRTGLLGRKLPPSTLNLLKIV
jgi:hypothetical protein